jgi:GTP cyclohydrolase II
MHVEQVLGDVPQSERCNCNEQPRQAKRSWFSRG